MAAPAARGRPGPRGRSGTPQWYAPTEEPAGLRPTEERAGGWDRAGRSCRRGLDTRGGREPRGGDPASLTPAGRRARPAAPNTDAAAARRASPSLRSHNTEPVPFTHHIRSAPRRTRRAGAPSTRRSARRATSAGGLLGGMPWVHRGWPVEGSMPASVREPDAGSCWPKPLALPPRRGWPRRARARSRSTRHIPRDFPLPRSGPRPLRGLAATGARPAARPRAGPRSRTRGGEPGPQGHTPQRIRRYRVSGGWSSMPGSKRK